ncbi:MAG: hypothetical protein AB1656_23310 [Candidatus Omnitrophota bacterium]
MEPLTPPESDRFRPVPDSLKKAIGVLFFLGMILGGLSLWSRYFIFTDGAIYAAAGKNLADGKGLTYCGGTHLFYPPGYPLAISLYYLALRDAELAGHLVSYTAYLASIALTAALAWRIRPSPVYVCLAAAMAVFHPQLVLHASSVLSESLFVCAILASSLCCWILAERRNASWGLWALWGGWLGYAYLIRADGLLYAPLQGIFIFVRQRNAWRNLPGRFLLAAAVLLFVMGPYLLLMRQEKGQWMLSVKTSILLEYSLGAMKGTGGLEETKRTSTLSEDGKTFAIDRSQETFSSFLFGHPGEAVRRVGHWTKYLLKQNGIAFGWMDIPLLLILWVGLGRSIASYKSLFVVLHLVPIFLFLLLYIDARFLLAFLPFIGFGAARALEQVWIWGHSAWNEKRSRLLLICAMALVFLAGAALGPPYGQRVFAKINKVFSPQSSLPLEHKQMGLWMKENLSITPATKISHRNPWISFYAEGCHKRTPYLSTPDELIRKCRELDIEYLVVDERMTKAFMPQYAPLLNAGEKREGLELLHVLEGTRPKIALYRVLNTAEESAGRHSAK